MVKKHDFCEFILTVDKCDECNSEVTEVCGDCIDTVCRPCHAKLPFNFNQELIPLQK